MHTFQPGVIRAEQAKDRAKRRVSARRIDPTIATVGSILSSDALPADAVTQLTRAGRYGSAFRALWQEAAPLVDADYFISATAFPNMGVAPFRAAVCFGVRRIGMQIEPFGIQDLQRLKSEAARCALAALGQPSAEWPDLERRERAAFLLGAIIRRRSE